MGKYSFGGNGPTFNDVSLSPAFSSISTTTTPATGSCAVQFIFKDINDNVIIAPTSGMLYLSEDSAGLSHALADTSLASLANGSLTNLGSAGPSIFTTTDTGLLGMTITALAGDYYVVIVVPNGSLLISDVCTIN